MTKPENVDTYIESFSPETQKLLQQMRATITEAAPLAIEVISYGMPAFKTESVLVYFAAHTKHIGFIQPVWQSKSTKQNCPSIKVPKAPFSFRLTSRCLWV